MVMHSYPFPYHNSKGIFIIPEFLSKMELSTATDGRCIDPKIYLYIFWNLFVNRYTEDPMHWRFQSYIRVLRGNENDLEVEYNNPLEIADIIKLQMNSGKFVKLGCIDRFLVNDSKANS